MNRWWLAAPVFAVTALLSVFGAAKGKNDATVLELAQTAMPVKVFSLKGYSPDEAPAFPGRVEAGDSAQLAFRVPGQMRSLNVRMGGRVEAGAVLAELDPTDYQLNLEARQAEFDLAQLEAQRASTLYKQQLISEDQFDTAQTLLTTSRAKLEQAREQLSYCKLRAPFAGAIAFTYAMPSEVVEAQQPVLNLQDISTLEVHFNLPPKYQPLLEGQERAAFTVAFELMPGVALETRYKEVGMRPDPDTNSYPLTLLVASPADFSARPGMSASVRMHHTSLLKTRWVLPREALFDRSPGRAHVWRIDPSNKQIQKLEVEVDEAGVLLAGLNAGDQIVAAGVDRLREGQLVRPWIREEGL